jgi:hypothetical protein
MASDLVIARSAEVATVSVSVAELLPPVGSVVPTGTATDAVFERVPVAEDATVPVTVNVAVEPLFRSIDRLMLPLFPEAGAPQLLPVANGETEQLHVAPVNAAGKVSLTFAPVTSEGPLFVTTIV